MILSPVDRMASRIDRFLNNHFPRFFAFSNAKLSSGFFTVLLFTGLLREHRLDDDREDIFNRTMVLVCAAHTRGWPVFSLDFLGKPTNFFSVKLKNGKKFIFEALPLVPIGAVLNINFDDKSVFKKFLKAHGFPYAPGGLFYTERAAIRFTARCGYPLVVKPHSGSLSQHVVCDIKDDAALRHAIRIVQMVSSEFIVERHIPGDVYRVTVVGGRCACCLRERPNVTGDGIRTIEALVREKNAALSRAPAKKKNATLHEINLDAHADEMLATQRLSRISVLPAGKKAYCHDKLILAAGADTYDTTDAMHLENRELFLRLAKILEAPVVGFDVICRDIAQPFSSQTCAIIEANSLPYIDIHHYPAHGAPRDVAGWIWDEWEKGAAAFMAWNKKTPLT